MAGKHIPLTFLPVRHKSGWRFATIARVLNALEGASYELSELIAYRTRRSGNRT